MSRDPKIPDPYVRAIYRFKAVGLFVILVFYWVIEAFVSPFGRWAAITLTVVAAFMPTFAITMLRGSIPSWLIRLSLYADAAVLTVGIHLGGGVDNVSMPLLYTILISLAALLLTRTDVALITAACAVFYDLMVFVEYAGMLPHLVPYSRPAARQLSTVIPVNLFLLLLGWLAAYAMEQIRAMYRHMEEIRQEAMHALSHDLKNPLAAIRDYASLLPTAAGDDRDAFTQGIQRTALQALDLVSNVLDAAAFEGRPITPDLVPVQLNDLVRDAMRRYESTAQTGRVTLRSELSPSLPTVHVDPQLITRAVGNLLSNAIKYGGTGGTVRILTGVDNGNVSIGVCDDGPGITASEQSQLFQRYSRTSSSRGVEGSGLGLYIVRCIVEAHRGSVSVRSEAGKGCSFTLSVPMGLNRGQ